jgi:hypothetical protein
VAAEAAAAEDNVKKVTEAEAANEEVTEANGKEVTEEETAEAAAAAAAAAARPAPAAAGAASKENAVQPWQCVWCSYRNPWRFLICEVCCREKKVRFEVCHLKDGLCELPHYFTTGSPQQCKNFHVKSICNIKNVKPEIRSHVPQGFVLQGISKTICPCEVTSSSSSSSSSSSPPHGAPSRTVTNTTDDGPESESDEEENLVQKKEMLKVPSRSTFIVCLTCSSITHTDTHAPHHQEEDSL